MQTGRISHYDVSASLTKDNFLSTHIIGHLFKVYKACSLKKRGDWGVAIVINTMARVYRVICGGSTGSWTRSSADMVSHCQREERGEEWWSRVITSASAPLHLTQSCLMEPNKWWPPGCGGDAMPPWDTDGRRGQRGTWRRGRRRSTRWRRRRVPGKAGDWRRSAGPPEPLTTGLLTPGLLCQSLMLGSGAPPVPPQSKSLSPFRGCKADLL